MSDAEWDEAKQRLPVGTRVSCQVTSHRHFGVFAGIPGVPFEGLIEIPDFKDEGRMTVGEYPAIGSTLTAVVLGYKEFGRQIWLGVKPSQLDHADSARKNLPTTHS